MNRSFFIAITALVISVAVNAWQFSRRSHDSTDQPPEPSPGRPHQQPRNRPAGSGAASVPGAEGTDLARKLNPEDLSLSGALAIRNPLDRYAALVAFVNNLPVEQIEATLEDLRSRSGKLDTEGKLLAHLLLTRWGLEDADAAFASLGRISAKQNGEAAAAILAALTSIDPERAVEWLADPRRGLEGQPWMGQWMARTIAEQWARQDPDATLSWATTLPSEQRRGALSGIVSKLLESDPQRAVTVAMEMDPGDRPDLLGQIAGAWAQQAPGEAMAWINTLAENERERPLREAFGSWASSAPSEAAAYLDQLPEPERPSYVSSIARTWAQQEPGEAASWLGNQPESAGKAEAMGHVMWNWTTSDPESAATWLGQQPAGDSYDSGVTGLAKAAAHAYDDPATAVNWAATIENESLRGRMTQHTLGVWMRQDAVSAQAWARANGVDLPGAGSNGK